MNNISPKIFKHWIHSHEEDTEDAKVYRSSDYEFPPSRGRRGFEIRDGGEFIQYDIAPTDGSRIVVGRWELEGPNSIRIYLENQKIKSYVINIISCEDNIMRIKK